MIACPGRTTWALLCESPVQRFRAPGQALRTAADLQVRYPLLSSVVPQVPPSCGPSAAHPGSERPCRTTQRSRSTLELVFDRWFGGDLARPGLGPADRGAAGAVRGAARRRSRHRPRAGRQGRAVPLRRRHQDLEPDAAGTPAPARGVRPAAGRLPRPSTNAAVAHPAKHRPYRDHSHLQNHGGPRPRQTRARDLGWHSRTLPQEHESGHHRG
jgi:hypothetical protein